MNDNQIVEKVINVLTQAPLIGHKQDMINFTQVYLKQVELAGLTYDQWNIGIGILLFGKYIFPTTEELMEKHLDETQIFEKIFSNQIEKYKQLSIEDKEKFHKGIDKAEEQMINPLTPNGQKNINGEILSSGPIGTYKILKDLRKLKEDILNDFDVKYILQTIFYNEETKILSFRNMDIEIQPTRKINKHHDLLLFLKKNGFEEEYSFKIIWESDFFQGHHDGKRTKENIKIYADQLQDRISNVTTEKYSNPISNFLLIGENSIQINPEYSN